jgi:hypothetical protein
MDQRLFMSLKEKEEFLHTELVRHGVEYHKAAEVARILLSGKPDELLTEKEIQLATEVCRKWIIQRKRLAFIHEQ